ncbi:hypothetical protein B0H17DRAFT_1199286 [Mycena rosella]|uniref:Wax synthase domain-containing protein n=1 Tax=Mycena rosella TaxID=1033263 RepID=A0AAD7DLA7_MYCRO|nr:hypothetical protein B0H17DRAFT_1199286 [Mycena rosella]
MASNVAPSQPLTTHARRLATALRLAPGSTTTRVVQNFVVFLLSGLMHHAAEFAVARTWSGGALLFFALQPLVILLGSALIVLFKARIGVESPLAPTFFLLLKALGYVWTLAWFTLTLPLWQDSLIHGEMMDRRLPAEVNLVEVIWRGIRETQGEVIDKVDL